MGEPVTPTDHLRVYAEWCIQANRQARERGLGDLGADWTTSPDEWQNSLVLDRTEPMDTDLPPEWRLVIHDCGDEDGYGWSVMGWYEPTFEEVKTLGSNHRDWIVTGWTLRAALHFGGDSPNLQMFYTEEEGFRG